MLILAKAYDLHPYSLCLPISDRNTKDLLFLCPPERFFRHLRVGFAEKGTVEAAVRDEDFKEFEYRFDVLIIPVIYISSYVLVPLVVNLLGGYIYDKFKNRASGTVKSEIHYTDPSGAQVSFKYEGSADTYEKVSTEHLRELGVWQEGTQLPDDNK